VPFVHEIAKYLQDMNGQMLVCEVRFTKSTDERVGEHRDILWLYGEEVYYCLSQANGDVVTEETVDRTLQAARSYNTISGFLLPIPPRDDGAIRRTFSDSDLQWIAERVQRIFVEAYDVDSYLLWKRNVDK